jgi:hypothetical protein
MRKLFFAVLMFLNVSVSETYAADVKDFRMAIAAGNKIKSTPNANEIARAIVLIGQSEPGVDAQLTGYRIHTIAKAIAKASEVSGVDWRLILAVAYVETGICNPKHMKGDSGIGGSFGCLQVFSPVWGKTLEKSGISKKDLLDTQKGIMVGAIILRSKVDQYGWKQGIKRYNGSGPKTDIYLANVLRIYKKIA